MKRLTCFLACLVLMFITTSFSFAGDKTKIIFLQSGGASGKWTVLDDSDIAADNISAAQASIGVMITNDGKGGAADYNIPAGTKGDQVYVHAEEAHVITLDLADSDDIIVLIDGTALAAGNAIDSDGSASSSIKLVCVTGDGGTATSYWRAVSQVGVWIDGGAD